MQCTSYLPACYYNRDLNVGTSCNQWPVLNSDMTSKSGRSHDVSVPLTTTDQYSGYNKEALRQTILRHEITFKDQLYELHRLYKRQKELIEESKRGKLNGRVFQFQESQQSPYPSRIQSDICQMTSQSLYWPNAESTCHQLSVPTTKQSQEPTTFVARRTVPSHQNPWLTKTISEGCNVLSSSTNVVSGHKGSDLELPANMYIVNGETKQFKEENAAEVPEYIPKKNVPEFPSMVDSKSNIVLAQNITSSDQSSRKTHCLLDLNEPAEVDESANSASLSHNLETAGSGSKWNSLPQLSSNRESSFPWNQGAISGSELSGRSLGFLAVDNPEVYSSSMSTSHQLFPRLESPIKTETTCSPSSQGKSICKLRKIPIAVQALPCFTTASSSSRRPKRSCDLDSISTVKDLDLNTTPSLLLEKVDSPEFAGNLVGENRSEESGKSSSFPSTKSDYEAKISESANSCGLASNIENSEKLEIDRGSDGPDHVTLVGNRDVDHGIKEQRTHEKFSSAKASFDLNSCLDEDEHSLAPVSADVIVKTGSGIDFEAPVSPENKERSPPRGESEDNQLETPIRSSSLDGQEPQDVDRIAAETIVALSSCSVQPSDASNDCLEWFAGIASSLASDLEKKLPSGRNKFRVMDDFEATTLELKEAELEDYCSVTNNPKVTEIVDFVSPGQTRGQASSVWPRKDCQKKVLPSVSSLSRLQVTNDLHTIKGLMITSDTVVATSKGQTKTSGKGCLRRRRRGSASTSEVGDEAGGSPLKKHKPANVCPAGWGKTSRRRRAPRARVSNPIV